MNDEKPVTAVATTPKREVRVVEDQSEQSYMLDTAKFEHGYRVAQAMAASSFLPQHLRGNNEKEAVANCFLVLNQSLRWGMDPWSVMPETYAVQGKLGYQGKLVAALVNSRANLVAPLSYAFDGDGDDMACTVSGQIIGEDNPRTVRLTVRQSKTSNKLWQTDPQQKLCYTGAVKWARRHCPEVLLGVASDDDVDRFAAAAPVREATTQSPVKTIVANVELMKDEA